MAAGKVRKTTKRKKKEKMLSMVVHI
nr:TPA_exp: hypothetical protein CAETHG_RS09315 [Clostridium autoethanogenum DSM 10061]